MTMDTFCVVPVGKEKVSVWHRDREVTVPISVVAAAPELLEIAKAIVEQFPLAGIDSKLGSNNPLEDLLARAEASLAKAEGK